jgi:hypothetical protein
LATGGRLLAGCGPCRQVGHDAVLAVYRTGAGGMFKRAAVFLVVSVGMLTAATVVVFRWCVVLVKFLFHHQ